MVRLSYICKLLASNLHNTREEKVDSTYRVFICIFKILFLSLFLFNEKKYIFQIYKPEASEKF
jgi:hypothetical protein